MKNLVKYRVHQVYVFLREAMPVMILVMLIFFGAAILGFQQDNKRLLEDTRATVKNTEVIVEKQDQTLDAIRQLSLDNKLTSKQLGDTIICMLLVPVGQRTDQTQEDCKSQAISQSVTKNGNGSTTSQPTPQGTPRFVESTPNAQSTPSPPVGPIESLWQILRQPAEDILNLLGGG